MNKQVEQARKAIADLEAQRPVLGDATVICVVVADSDGYNRRGTILDVYAPTIVGGIVADNGAGF